MAVKLKIVREILRLYGTGKSMGAVAKQLHISKSTVQKYVKRAEQAVAPHSVLMNLPDEAAQGLVAPRRRQQSGLVEPDWEAVFIAYTQNHVPLRTLWEHYVAEHGEKYTLKYSAFCNNYNKYVGKLPTELADGYLALNWSPGEYVQIDYSGDGIEIVDQNKATFTAQIFVAVLPYSGYIFAYATRDQTRDSWLDSLIMLFEHLGGVPVYLTLDNTRALVKKASKFNPVLADEFKGFCTYYGIEADAVNPYAPRQKGAVENAVKQVQKSIIKPLAEHRFFKLVELNNKLADMLKELNNRPMKMRANRSRRELVERELPLLQPLPAVPYELSLIVKHLKVRRDGCIRLNNARYSVPYQYIGKPVDVFIMPRARRLLIKEESGVLIADHLYRGMSDTGLYQKHEHLTEQHQFVLSTPEERIEHLSKCGPKTTAFCEHLRRHLAVPTLQRHLQGLYALEHEIGPEKLEECCEEALKSSTVNFEKLHAIVRANQAGDETRTSRKGNKHRVSNAKSVFRGENYFKSTDKEQSK